jgi:hypothetical protein
MRFYGIPSEDRALELLARMPEGRWVFVEDSIQTELDLEQAREKLREIFLLIKGWKEGNKYIPQTTTFIFVHTPDQPKHFKIYDLSSLGCSINLNLPKWECYLLENK